MVEFEITGIIEHSVAALALWAVLGQQKVVHLGSAHLLAVWLFHTLFHPEEWGCFLTIVGAGR